MKLKTWIAERWTLMISMLLIITLFCLPISPSLKSVMVILSALAILLTPAYRQTLTAVFYEPWCIAAVGFFGLILLACFWSPADDHTRLVCVEKYSKLLYLPVFAVGFQHRLVRRLAMYAFLLAMLLTCLLSLFIYHADPGQVFRNHIVTSYMMAFAAYLSGLFAIQEPFFKKRWPFLLLFLLFTYQLIFFNSGRSGYIIYFALMILLLALHLPFKKMLLSLLVFSALFALLCYESSVFNIRIHQLLEDWNQLKNGTVNTSLGFRWMFHHLAKSLFISSPWIGHGTGSFAYYFQQTNTLEQWKHLLDPHSQYWLVAAELGLLGLTTATIFFLSLIRAALRLDEMKPILLGMLLAFFIGNITDSLLFYSVIGYLFIVFTALCLGEKLVQHPADEKGDACLSPIVS